MSRISLIISVYKRLDFLELVLQGVDGQSYRDFEVLVAEDDDALATRDFLVERRRRSEYPIKHVFQEDAGFRKNRALNAALRSAEGEAMVFLDGDCIPHRHFLRTYARRLQPRVALFGRRAMVSRGLTVDLVRGRSIRPLGLLSLLLSGSRKVEDALYLPWRPRFKKSLIGIWGCNWGIRRDHLWDVNGFDEDYEKAGIGEDVDIEWRLKATGVTLRSVKNQAVVYHLFHEAHYGTATVQDNQRMCREKMESGKYFCVNGLRKS